MVWIIIRELLTPRTASQASRINKNFVLIKWYVDKRTLEQHETKVLKVISRKKFKRKKNYSTNLLFQVHSYWTRNICQYYQTLENFHL